MNDAMRAEKSSMVEEIRKRVEDASYLLLVDHTGITVSQTQLLRRKLADGGAEVHVVKNRLLKQAVADFSYSAGLGVWLKGSTSMVTGCGDAAQVAKVLKDFIKENKILAFKAGVLEGKPLAAEGVAALADLPSKPVMQAILLGTLAAPMSQLVGVCNQKVASIVYVLKAAQEKKQAAA